MGEVADAATAANTFREAAGADGGDADPGRRALQENKNIEMENRNGHFRF